MQESNDVHNEGGVSRESIPQEVAGSNANQKNLKVDVSHEINKVSPIAIDKLHEVSPAKTEAASSPTKSIVSGLSTRKLTRKSTSIVEPAKKHKKSYVLAMGASISFGMANYFMSDLSIRKGIYGIPAQGFGFLITWMIYYIYRIISHKLKFPKEPFLTKKSSMYFEQFIDEDAQPSENSLEIEDDVESPQKNVGSPTSPSSPDNLTKSQPKGKEIHELTWLRVSAPLSRAISQLIIQIVIIQTFNFAAQSGVNGGIIATIFSSSSLFSIIIFYFKYGQKITKLDYLGTFFIISCVVLIAQGGTTGSSVDVSDEERKEKNMYLAFSLLFAVLSGFVLSLNTVSIQYTIMASFELDQANYDGNGFLGFLLIPFFIALRDSYEFMDLFIATVVVFFVTLGVIFLSRALQCGIAGPVQAIENSKTVVTTLMCAIFLSQIPNLMQLFGLITGLIGVAVIVIQKKDDIEAKEIQLDL